MKDFIKAIIVAFLIAALLLPIIGCTKELDLNEDFDTSKNPQITDFQTFDDLVQNTETNGIVTDINSNQTTNEIKDTEQDESTSDIGLDTESSSTTSPDPNTQINPGISNGTQVIYYEDFEDEKASGSTNDVLGSLGWVAGSVANGALYDNSANYSIVSKFGSNKLFVANNKTDGTDSYVTVLSDALMGKFHEQNYTYQYDILYSSAGDAKRYITLLNGYGGDVFNSFHLRINSSANNQIYINNSWYSYDTKGINYAASTDKNSISNKIFGKSFSENQQLLQGVSVSIRYVVDWENGNSVYLRLNEDGYTTSGKWILVSKLSSTSKGAPYFKSNIGGSAIVLKIGGKVNGYLDNIIVWKGTGDEPSDKSAPLISSKDTNCSGHNFSGTGTCVDPIICLYCGELSKNNTNGNHNFVSISYANDSKCTYCHSYRSSIDAGWDLSQVPFYVGGSVSRDLYLSGQGISSADLIDDVDSKMCIVYGTSVPQFEAYREKLLDYDAKEVFYRQQDGNIYVQYSFHGNFVYTYYTKSVNEVRIIFDTHSEVSTNDFGYSYNKEIGQNTVLYQYGLPMKDGSEDDANKIGYGMMYVIKLADNSVFIIDGGGYQQFDTAQIDGFMKFLRTITNTKDGEKIKISAWYISHCHQDHLAGFLLFVKKYHKNLDFDRVFYNFPSVNTRVDVMVRSESVYSNLLKYIDSYIKDDGVQYIKIHTGQSFNIADARVDVLYTHEDLVSPTSGKTEIVDDYNNSSSVISIEFDGKRFLCLGDINKPAMKILYANNGNESLKCDIIQPAHHVSNDLTELYHITQSTVALVPQSIYTINLNTTRKKVISVILKYADQNQVYYANESTIGLAVEDGVLKKVFSAKVDGGKHTGWNW